MCGTGQCYQCLQTLNAQAQNQYSQNAVITTSSSSSVGLRNTLGNYGGLSNFTHHTFYPVEQTITLTDFQCKERIQDFKKRIRSKEEVITYLKLCMYEKEIDSLRYLEFLNDLEKI